MYIICISLLFNHSHTIFSLTVEENPWNRNFTDGYFPAELFSSTSIKSLPYLNEDYADQTLAMNGECNSEEYIAKSFYCDGGLFQGNAWKPPECADSSDE